MHKGQEGYGMAQIECCFYCHFSDEDDQDGALNCYHGEPDSEPVRISPLGCCKHFRHWDLQMKEEESCSDATQAA